MQKIQSTPQIGEDSQNPDSRGPPVKRKELTTSVLRDENSGEPHPKPRPKGKTAPISPAWGPAKMAGEAGCPKMEIEKKVSQDI